MRTTRASQWDTGYPVPAERREGYTHLIRSVLDPDERTKRGKENDDRAPHLTLRRTTTRAEWRERIAALLADDEPRTFNRIAVELTGRTADVVFATPVNDGLWDAVEAGVIEHTMKAPILFRRAKGGAQNGKPDSGTNPPSAVREPDREADQGARDARVGH